MCRKEGRDARTYTHSRRIRQSMLVWGTDAMVENTRSSDHGTNIKVVVDDCFKSVCFSLQVRVKCPVLCFS